MKFFIIFLFLFGYANSQDCGNCFPGTSSSLCPYRAASDPIICGSDGKKYTPCTYNCVKRCVPSLSIAGCGSQCIKTSGTSCPVVITTTQPPYTAPTVRTAVPSTTPPTISTTPPSTTITETSPKPTCKNKDDTKCQFTSKPSNSCDVPTMTIQCERCNFEDAAVGLCDQVGYCYDEEPDSAICDVQFDPSECDMNPESEACITCPPESPAKGICRL